MVIIFVDTETGGPEPQKHSLLSIGACVYEDDKIEETFHMTIQHDTYRVTVDAIDCVRYHDDSVDLQYCVEQFRQWLIKVHARVIKKQLNLRLGGSNPSLVDAFLRPRLPFWDGVFSKGLIDIRGIATFLCDVGLIDRQSTDLSVIAGYFNLDTSVMMSHTYNALDTAIMAARVYHEMKMSACQNAIEV